MAADRWLAYATGGLAIGHAEGVVNATGNNNYDETASDANTHYGYAVGGGVEYALHGNWSIKGEYLYTSFGARTYELSFPIPGREHHRSIRSHGIQPARRPARPEL